MTPDPGVSSMRQTTCYMCTCRCGINVHLRDGVPIRIEGNPAHPKNHGVLCGKGAAGLQHHFSAARLRKPWRPGQRNMHIGGVFRRAPAVLRPSGWTESAACGCSTRRWPGAALTGMGGGLADPPRRRRVASVLLFALPLILTLIGGTALSAAAVVSASAGVLLERWLFFAEARHISSAWYSAGRQ